MSDERNSELRVYLGVIIPSMLTSIGLVSAAVAGIAPAGSWIFVVTSFIAATLSALGYGKGRIDKKVSEIEAKSDLSIAMANNPATKRTK